MDIEDDITRGGYFTVFLEENGIKIPHVVFANSALHAAHKIKLVTGYLPRDMDVEGPYNNTIDIPASATFVSQAT